MENRGKNRVELAKKIKAAVEQEYKDNPAILQREVAKKLGISLPTVGKYMPRGE